MLGYQVLPFCHNSSNILQMLSRQPNDYILCSVAARLMQVYITLYSHIMSGNWLSVRPELSNSTWSYQCCTNFHIYILYPLLDRGNLTQMQEMAMSVCIWWCPKLYETGYVSTNVPNKTKQPIVPPTLLQVPPLLIVMPSSRSLELANQILNPLQQHHPPNPSLPLPILPIHSWLTWFLHEIQML